MKKFVFACCSIALWAAASPAATIATYTDPAAWTAAVGGIFVTEPFDPAGLQPFTLAASSAGTIGDARGVLTGSVWNDRVTRAGGESTTFLYLPDFVMGFAALWDTTPGGEGQRLSISATLATGESQFVGEIGPISDNPFWGFASDVPLDFFTIAAGSGPGIAETFDMANLQFGGVSSASGVPEPLTFIPVGLGLLALGWLRRR